MTLDLIALRPICCSSCMSFSTKEVRGSNLSIRGNQGGPLKTTFTPWKYLSLPSPSTTRCVSVFTCRQPSSVGVVPPPKATSETSTKPRVILAEPMIKQLTTIILNRHEIKINY